MCDKRVPELEVAEHVEVLFGFDKEHIGRTAHVRYFGDGVREIRLRWFGHVQRKDSEYIDRRVLSLEEDQREDLWVWRKRK